MNRKAIAAIALQMILWHSTTNGGTMLYHGRGRGKIEANDQTQDFLLFEQDAILPGAVNETQIRVEGQETSVTTGDIFRLKYEADRDSSWSNGVSDGNYDPLDPRFGDYDPYDPGLNPD